VASLVNGVDGVLHAASVGTRALGQGLTSAQGLAPRHAITQIDRLLSTTHGLLEEVVACCVPFVIGERSESVVEFDWTEARGRGSGDGRARDADEPRAPHAARVAEGHPLGPR